MSGGKTSKPCHRAYMDSLKVLILETYKMPCTEILQVRNCLHITVILKFYLVLMSKSVTLKILRRKLVKLDCIIM